MIGWAALRLRVEMLSGELEPAERIDVALPDGYPTSSKVVFSRHQVSEEFVDTFDGIRTASLPYLAVQECATDDGALFTQLYGDGHVWPSQLESVLPAFAGTRGQAHRKQVVAKLLRDPWSVAEKRLQKQLLDAGIDNWIGNVGLQIQGRTVVVDIWFEAEMVAIEFDGREYHSAPDSFLRDREKHNLLLLAGTRVVRVTWSMLKNPYKIISIIRAVLAQPGHYEPAVPWRQYR